MFGPDSNARSKRIASRRASSIACLAFGMNGRPQTRKRLRPCHRRRRSSAPGPNEASVLLRTSSRSTPIERSAAASSSPRSSGEGPTIRSRSSRARAWIEPAGQQCPGCDVRARVGERDQEMLRPQEVVVKMLRDLDAVGHDPPRLGCESLEHRVSLLGGTAAVPDASCAPLACSRATRPRSPAMTIRAPGRCRPGAPRAGREAS